MGGGAVFWCKGVMFLDLVLYMAMIWRICFVNGLFIIISAFTCSVISVLLTLFPVDFLYYFVVLLFSS